MRFHRVSFICTSQNATLVARHYMYVATINNNHLLYRIELYAKRGNTTVKIFHQESLMRLEKEQVP